MPKRLDLVGASLLALASTLRQDRLAILIVLGSSGMLLLEGGWALVAWPYDWGVLAQLPSRLADGSLYALDPTYNFIWSPAAGALIAALVVPFGYWGWFAAHVLVLAFLRDRRVIALALLSLSLWADAGLGNTIVFAAVAGILALRGSTAGEVASLALFVLIPRPLQLPLVVWLLWHRPHLRLPFIAMALAVGVSAYVTGYLEAWVAAALSLAAAAADGPANFGPTSLVGAAWFLVAVPGAIVLTRHRRVGLAGLLLSPYLYPQYLLFILLDVHERRRVVSRPAPALRRRDDPIVLAPLPG